MNSETQINRPPKAVGIYLLTLAVACFIVLITVVSLMRTEAVVRADLGKSLQSTLGGTQEAIRTVYRVQMMATKVWAKNPQLLQLAEDLLKVPRTYEDLKGAEAQKTLRAWLQPFYRGAQYRGYFVIGPDWISLASSRNANINTLNLLSKQEGFLERVWDGETLVSLPQKSDVPLGDFEGEIFDDAPTMFVATPIQDAEGKTIAILAFRLEPDKVFSGVFERGQFWESGETYAFNKEGLLLSESRFNEQLDDFGLIKHFKHSVLDLKVQDPGVDLTSGKSSALPRDQQPLTLMAKSATSGVSGMNLDGYRDYRGVKVVGAWVWDEELGFGMTTEIDVEEAFRSLQAVRADILFSSVLIIVLLVIVAAIWARTQKRIAVSEQRLSSIIDNSAEGIVVADGAGLISLFNHAAEEMFGYTAEDMIGQNVSVLAPDDIKPHHDAYMKDSDLKAPRIVGMSRNLQGRRKDGTTFPLELSVAQAQTGQEKMLVGILHDSTERREAAKRLQEAKERTDMSNQILQAVLDTIPVRVFWKDKALRYLGCNKVFAKDASFMSPTDVVGMTDLAMPWKGQAALYRADDQKVLDTGESKVNYEEEQSTPFGGKVWLRTSKAPLRDASGEIFGVLGTYEDITERKRNEEDIKIANRDMAMLSECNEAVARCNDEQELLAEVCRIIVETNQRRLAWIGYAEQDEQRSVRPVAHFGFDDGYLDEVQISWSDDKTGQGPMGSTIRTGKSFPVQRILDSPEFLPWREHAKKRGYASILGVPLGCGEDSFGGIAIYADEENSFDEETIRRFERLADNVSQGITRIRSIAARLEAEAGLKAAKDDAERANQAKSEFLSSMSHELRTPLNAILGFSQMLEFNPKEPLTKAQSSCVTHIIKGGNHLLELINEVLDLAKIEAGKLDLSLEDVSMNDILGECLSLVGTLAEKRDIEIKPLETDPAAWAVRADYTRFKQVLLNLLSNAIKYNRDAGTVTIDLSESGDGYLRISVTDTGEGIAEDQTSHVFQPFNRLGAEASEIEGTGIGLTITKDLVEMMDGRIGFSSEVGVGSAFWVELPQVGARTKEAEVIQDVQGKFLSALDATLLYVEDNPANVELMELVVARVEGLKMITAPNAELGLELANSRKPDVIVLDINLPGMNGIEAAKVLRHRKSTKGTPILALSAAATKRDVEKGLEAGFDRYLTKPMQIEQVLEAIQEVLSEKLETET